MLLNGFLEEGLKGCQTAVSLHSVVSGCCGMDLHLVLGAHSVFDAVTAQEASTPTEIKLIYGVRALREHLEARRLKSIHRVDTRDLLCDALTKRRSFTCSYPRSILNRYMEDHSTRTVTFLEPSRAKVRDSVSDVVIFQLLRHDGGMKSFTGIYLLRGVDHLNYVNINVVVGFETCFADRILSEACDDEE
eukprot:891828-Pyramimonas_sp.AAC.1